MDGMENMKNLGESISTAFEEFLFYRLGTCIIPEVSPKINLEQYLMDECGKSSEEADRINTDMWLARGKQAEASPRASRTASTWRCTCWA